MRLIKYFILIFFCQFALAQNWNVFNKNYRYNYRFDNAALVTNVLFADTVKQVGTDTIYSLNRIGVECTSGCPTFGPPSQTLAVWVNMPQFLQRSVKKYSNGTVRFYDPGKLVIIPTCTLNQSWLFDTINNKTALCTAIASQTLFGVSDSLKTIIVNGVDSIQLSKNFGVILFPKLYAQNKYYRLTGIENKSSYDQTSLYGEKVPNAWDFYNFSVNDTFNLQQSSYQGGLAQASYSLTSVFIKNKSVSPTGYSYLNERINKYFWMPMMIFSGVPCHYNFPLTGGIITNTTTTITSTYANLSSINYLENKMYPGMIVKPTFGPSSNNYSYADGQFSSSTHQIVKFGLDNTGTFYKYVGNSCQFYTPQIMPNNNEAAGFDTTVTGGNLCPSYFSGVYEVCFGVGLGKVNQNSFFFEGGGDYYINSARINGVLYFGPNYIVGINELKDKEDNAMAVYPNPTQTQFQLNNSESVTVSIQNALGQEVDHKSIGKNEPVDVQSLPNGVYFITVKSGANSFTKKLIVQH